MTVNKPKTADLNPGIGFRIREYFDRLDYNFVRRFQEFDTPDISDLMNRLYTMNPAIRNLTHPDMKIIGTACTVKVYPGDNLMVHRSLDVALPNDVIVVDAGGSSANAIVGDLICTKAQHRGIAGFVVDGYIRDIEAIKELNFPVYARGITPVGPLHRGPGEINYPIQAGGIVIHPGDIILGDQNGVVVVPQGVARLVFERLLERQQSQLDYVEAVRRGEFSNKWVEQILADKECEIDSSRCEVPGVCRE